MECGLPVHQRYSILAVCPQYCVTCSTDGGMSVVHTLLFVQKVTRPSNETGSPSLHAASTRRRTAIITDQLLPATHREFPKLPYEHSNTDELDLDEGNDVGVYQADVSQPVPLDCVASFVAEPENAVTKMK